MRLTHLKLAGFKSFVDPTTLHIHGQRTGVVGPNGCGKSNVMESVRWVLGESSAKEMRADAMDAVIFNGSANRKPISRASVELVFDNSLGGASGEWSQYAEISVKRVIERDKGSTYYINNSVVRRRDVADLFLGTGLGGRAYAIIGQNTITRIVEAKPEELRIFLEEAAGISKYKERRRETELRLRDTRENLIRVEDILRELDKQISRLQSQAVVAEQYHQLQEALKLAKAQVWLLKRRDASARWGKAQRNVEKLVNELEAQMANLRSNESALETARQNSFAATEAVNVAQASYYEVNAEVSNLENQVKNTADARSRLEQQIKQFQAQLEKNDDQNSQLESALAAAKVDLDKANVDFSDVESKIQIAKNNLPALSKQFQDALAKFNESQTIVSNAEQHLRLEQANLGHISRNLTETNEYIRRIEQSLGSIQLIPDNVILEKQTLHDAVASKLTALEKTGSALQLKEQKLMVESKTQREILNQKQRILSILEAEIKSLSKIQQDFKNGNNETALNNWLINAGLDNKARFWQSIKIKKGWEAALEVILGGRLNAVTDQHLNVSTRPPKAMTIALESQSTDNKTNAKRKTLYDLVEKIDEKLKLVLQDWLSGVYVLDSDEDAQSARQSLSLGDCLINQQGDIYTSYSVTYFGAQPSQHGVLERQASLDALEQQLPEAQIARIEAQAIVAKIEEGLLDLRNQQQSNYLELKSATQRQHQLNLELQQLKQSQQNVLHRQQTMQNDSALAVEKKLGLQADIEAKQVVINEINQNVKQTQTLKSLQEVEKQKADSAWNFARNQLQNMERMFQESNYNVKLKNNHINELNSKINYLHEEKASLKLRINDCEVMLESTQMQVLKDNLTRALNNKQTREQALIAARNEMSESEQALLSLERVRLQGEQAMHPLRDNLEAARLSEQEARIYFDQCQTELANCSIKEDELVRQLSAFEIESDAINVADVEKKYNKIGLEITALGAVNLAAIQELETEQTRKNYLDSQCKDLTEASETLEDAIRKIDKETRGRLQGTFDEANRHFGELFATLFGGGQARLELLGEEILDTGMQVFAQPPGKKNSTIHLLSGGEKALTALALVFALFRLNPAPFCLMDEVDAPLDDSNTERFCAMVKKMSEKTQFLYVSHNKISMEMAQQLIGVTMQESGVSRIVDVDMETAVKMTEEAAA